MVERIVKVPVPVAVVEEIRSYIDRNDMVNEAVLRRDVGKLVRELHGVGAIDMYMDDIHVEFVKSQDILDEAAQRIITVEEVYRDEQGEDIVEKYTLEYIMQSETNRDN